MPRKKTTTKARKYRYTSRRHDKHKLYEISVQCPEADVDFLDGAYKKANKRRPVTLMEDFCGTSLLSRRWVESREGRKAIGVDLDPDVLEWARRQNLAPLGDRAEDITLIEKSVLDVRRPKVDVRVGFNFSYRIFQDRDVLKAYFKAARASLKPGGMFVIDLHGGPDAQQEVVEKKKFAGFKYVWEQGELNPIDQRMLCYIHFEFPDRSAARKAFVYDWRLWGMMELRDVMTSAGFSKTEVYWEGTDPKTEEGDGVFLKKKKAENDPSWIAYIVAWL